MNKTVIISDTNKESLNIKKFLVKRINSKLFKRSNLVIVIGGDGFMLKTLKKKKKEN